MQCIYTEEYAEPAQTWHYHNKSATRQTYRLAVIFLFHLDKKSNNTLQSI